MTQKIKLSEIRELVRKALNESDIKEDKNPCWKGYEQIGMKMKNGKEVPNCVPIKEEDCSECKDKKIEETKVIKLSEIRELVKKTLKESDNYQDTQLNVIIIDDFNDFVRLSKDRLKSEDMEQAFRNGYWNVYMYNDNLKYFLDSTDIKYRIKPFNTINR